MSRLLVAPLIFVCLLCVAFILFGERVLSRAPMHSSGARDHERFASLDKQRQLADCYRKGCVEVRRSAVLSCAWRLIITEETHDPSDHAEAAKDCDGLGPKERSEAERAKDTLLRRVQASGSKTHL